jgi:hypothetical protein
MDSLFLQNIQQQVEKWREEGRQGIFKETKNILRHIERTDFLHNPQVEALETYIFMKEVLGNKPSVDIFRQSFSKERDFIKALGISDKDALDLAYDDNKDEKIQSILNEQFGASDYANQVYALTMGSGKTILMAVMMMYDFVLSFHHPEDGRFAKNALVFAPDTTIIESLKEIKTFDYSRVLPREYENILLNIKYHYLESTKTVLTPIGNYNIIVSNSQKIILKTKHKKDDAQMSFKDVVGDKKSLEKKEIENARLSAIRELSSLQIFVDEAHHSYGTSLEGDLKKVRQTIDYLHESTPLVSVVNLTGTPYVNNKMIADVVYHFGLKQGIETGILKKIKIFDYGTVKSEKFLEEVIEVFTTEYGTKRLEGRLPKIAFYASNIKDLQGNLKPKLEKILATRDISLDTILEYHTEAEGNADDFKALDTIDSNKQFVLLVGKGTEGWNCRSLVSVALYKKPKSNILVLQSTTRCLRAIGKNDTVARVFLAKETASILDKELKKNFNSSIADLSNQEQKMVEHTLKVEKRKTIAVKKKITEIISAEKSDATSIKIDFKRFKADDYKSYVSEGGISVDEDGEAVYREAKAVRMIEENNDYTFYEIVAIINRYTHLSSIAVVKIIEGSGKTREAFTKMVNKSSAMVPFVIRQILDNAYTYDTKEYVIEDEIELTKAFPFKINVQPNSLKSRLVVYREDEEAQEGKSRIGFHINPYAFDGGDERELLRYLRGVLNDNEVVRDVYFTGSSMCADPSRTDFYFEYWNPEENRMALYYPDFLIETSEDRYLIVETKGSDKKFEYLDAKSTFDASGGDIDNVVLAKEIGFQSFQEQNKNFDYKIIFDDELQQEQVRLFQELTQE